MAVLTAEGRLLGEGRAIDVRASDHTAPEVRAAIRDGGTAISVDCPAPSPYWPALCRPDDGTEPLRRVVAAARSRGHHPPVERDLAAAERALRALSVETVDTESTRRRLADAGEEVERLRESVATARGRLRSRRELDADTAEAEAALDDATRELSEAETERLAAEQAHEAARRRAREARAVRDRRLRLQDRVANRRREARRALAATVAAPFAAAVDAVPGEATLSTDPLGVEGDPVTAALAAVRVADLRAPVIDATERFGSAAGAAEALETAVVRV